MRLVEPKKTVNMMTNIEQKKSQSEARRKDALAAPLGSGVASKFSTCFTCGYSWLTGEDGSHSCDHYLLQKIKSLERDWKLENRIIELLIVGGFVKREKAEEARQLLTGME